MNDAQTDLNGNLGTPPPVQPPPIPQNQKFCKHCGQKIDAEAVLCIHCGRQVEELKSAPNQPSIVINNTNDNVNSNTNANVMGGGMGNAKNKWLAFLLCLFIGYIGAHKFYEGKILMGVVYLFTFGLFGIGWIIDTIILLFKPNPYYV